MVKIYGTLEKFGFWVKISPVIVFSDFFSDFEHITQKWVNFENSKKGEEKLGTKNDMDGSLAGIVDCNHAKNEVSAFYSLASNPAETQNPHFLNS